MQDTESTSMSGSLYLIIAGVLAVLIVIVVIVLM